MYNDALFIIYKNMDEKMFDQIDGVNGTKGHLRATLADNRLLPLAISENREMGPMLLLQIPEVPFSETRKQLIDKGISYPDHRAAGVLHPQIQGKIENALSNPLSAQEQEGRVEGAALTIDEVYARILSLLPECLVDCITLPGDPSKNYVIVQREAINNNMGLPNCGRTLFELMEIDDGAIRSAKKFIVVNSKNELIYSSDAVAISKLLQQGEDVPTIFGRLLQEFKKSSDSNIGLAGINLKRQTGENTACEINSRSKVILSTNLPSFDEASPLP